MKTRVYKYGKYYYPQYKGWVFWNFMYDTSTMMFEESAVHFDTAEEAIKYLQDGNWVKYREVVWESKK
jgi:hypothetical protein